MLELFKNQLQNEFSFLQEKKLLLAVSGGIDSMVLVHLCQQLKLNFAIAHCNFQLREEESNDDENFVTTYAKSNNIQLFVTHFDTKNYASQHNLSIQVAARNLRYDWFYTLLSQNNFDFLLTAHHLDDSLETFLINFTRGSGIDGLLGIPQQNDKIVRPLLCFSRNEIETFAKNNNITWREDSSNSSTKYLRNKLRHDVIPILKELNPSLENSFVETILHLNDLKSIANDAVKKVYDEVISSKDDVMFISLKKLEKHTNYKAYLYQWLQQYNFQDWQSVYDLVQAQTGKKVLSASHVLLKNRNHLELHAIQEEKQSVEFFIEKNQTQVKFPLNLTLNQVELISDTTTNTIFVDAEKLQFPLQIRKWQTGDVFHPFGMKGKKKVSKFFKDEKLSVIEKQQQWLLCSNNKIVWIIGKRADDRFKVSAKTTTILKIKFEP
jgi:tRNA(Ile)-lysidine synthase